MTDPAVVYNRNAADGGAYAVVATTWAERVRKLAIARKAVAGDPLTRLTAELDRVLWEVK